MVQDGSEQDYISNALKQYNKVSKHVKVKRIDPVVNPGFAKKQGIDDEISSNDVIVVNNKTKSAEYISNEDMYIESNSMYSFRFIIYLSRCKKVSDSRHSKW